MIIVRFAVLGIAILLNACARDPNADAIGTVQAESTTQGEQPSALVDIQVRSIAARNAIANGIDLTQYEAAVVALDSSGSEPAWRVTFKMKPPALPGSYYMVPVTDQMRKAAFPAAGEQVPPNTSLEPTRDR